MVDMAVDGKLVHRNPGLAFQCEVRRLNLNFPWRPLPATKNIETNGEKLPKESVVMNVQPYTA